MRNIAIVGAGQAGLQLALGLQQHGYAVTLVSDRTPESIWSGSVMSTQAMFHDALETERALGLNLWEDECPPMESMAIRVAGPDDELVRTVDHLVICGGLQSDRLGELVGGPKAPRIVPFRGEYMRVTAAKQELVRGMVYPVPDPRYPFLGVHFTRRVDGSLEVGPNAFLALSRSRYGRLSFDARDLGDTLAFGGFWSFARDNWRAGVTELRGVLSRRAYMAAAQRYVPQIGAADVVRAGLGLRAQALERDGSLVDDFVIHASDEITSVRNAPSPAATSSLAIAEHIVDAVLGETA